MYKHIFYSRRLMDCLQVRLWPLSFTSNMKHYYHSVAHQPIQIWFEICIKGSPNCLQQNFYLTITLQQMYMVQCPVSILKIDGMLCGQCIFTNEHEWPMELILKMLLLGLQIYLLSVPNITLHISVLLLTVVLNITSSNPRYLLI